MSATTVIARVEAVAQPFLAPLPEREVPADGLPLTVAWRPVLGATAAVVEAASLELAPVPASHVGLSVPATVLPQAGAVDIRIDGPTRPVRTVTLSGLKVDGISSELRSEADVSTLAAEAPGPPWRLCVAIDQGAGFGMIRYAVPPVRGRGAVPPVLVGASFSNGVLRLPDMPAVALRLSLQRGNFPEDFAQHGATLASASVRVAPGPVNLRAEDANGPIWATAGPFTERATIDLTNAVERALNADPAAASATVTLKAAAGGRLHAGDVTASGHLLRAFDGKVQVALAGDEQPLPVNQLDGRVPSQVSADVILKHDGLRLHPLSDAAPTTAGGLSGVVVGATRVRRRLSPEALRKEALVRIGVVGFGESGTLTLRVLEAGGARAGEALPGAHGEAPVTPTKGAAAPAITWIALAKAVPIDRPITIEVAASERYLWVAGESEPLLRFAVATDPGGSVAIADKSFAMSGPRTELPGESLPAQPFAGGPVWAVSDQFCTVTLSNLRLKYPP